MSGYSYGPPPPPPSASGSGNYNHPSPSYPSHSQSRGGGSSHSRRGGHHHGSRGEYHGAQPRYEYATPPYPTPNAAPYAGPHTAVSAYPQHQPQWPVEHGQPPSHHTHPHAPVPLSTTNYHPNYAPPSYPPSQYPQQPSYGPPQPYVPPYQAPPPQAQPQWTSQGAHQPIYGSSRGRGGYSDRGAHKPPHTVVPVRHEYEAAPPPMNGSFGQPYTLDPRVSHYPPPHYPYSGPPPPPGPPHQEASYHDQQRRRGRGGHRDGNTRGRGGHHNHHNNNNNNNNSNSNNSNNDKPRHQKQQNHTSDSTAKPEPPSVGKKKKRKMNTLGLTPGMDSETEDDEGEEKVLTELIGHESLEISDVAAFLAERKKNFPTKARIEAKKATELAREKEIKAVSLEKEADRLRKQLRRVEFSIKRKREQGDEGDEMRDPSDDSSDDEPEVQSSRPEAATAPPSHPAKKADITRHCKYYSTGGTCGKKGKCRFVHDPQVREAALKEREANNGRLTIQQRLILNDKEQEDLAVLQSIQYLREKGLMASTEPKEIRTEKEVKKDAPRPASAAKSSLPAASPSLPPPPVKREPPHRKNPPPSIIPNADSISTQGLKHYQGWLLKPYGSSSGKQAQSDNLP